MTGAHRPGDRLVGKITTRLRRGFRNQAGFTLIELLVVIIIIAILASIAIPTFLGQRQHAQDAAAYSLVRNALTALQGAFVETADYTQITEADLRDIEPSIDWVIWSAGLDLVSTTPAEISDDIGAAAGANQVAFFAQSAGAADLASISTSGNSFGIQVDTVNVNETGYVKVKVIDGSADVGW